MVFGKCQGLHFDEALGKGAEHIRAHHLAVPVSVSCGENWWAMKCSVGLVTAQTWDRDCVWTVKDFWVVGLLQSQMSLTEVSKDAACALSRHVNSEPLAQVKWSKRQEIRFSMASRLKVQPNHHAWTTLYISEACIRHCMGIKKRNCCSGGPREDHRVIPLITPNELAASKWKPGQTTSEGDVWEKIGVVPAPDGCHHWVTRNVLCRTGT